MSASGYLGSASRGSFRRAFAKGCSPKSKKSESNVLSHTRHMLTRSSIRTVYAMIGDRALTARGFHGTVRADNHTVPLFGRFLSAIFSQIYEA